MIGFSIVWNPFLTFYDPSLKCSIRELMIVGRVFVVVMIGVSIVWIPAIERMQGGQLYLYIQSVSSNLAPPIAAVYLLAVLWKRANEQVLANEEYFLHSFIRYE